MPSILVNAGDITSAVVLWAANVADIGQIDVKVYDNGGGSTITYETSADNSSWTAFTGGFVVTAGTLTAIGGSTTTAKGIFTFPVTAKYFRARVSTYVSGTVRYEVDYNVQSFGRTLFFTADTLTAVGSTQATALALVAWRNRISTAAASTGVTLPNGSFAINESVWVRNDGANAITVYPATAAGKINSGSAGAGVSVPAASSRVFVNTGVADNWLAV